MAMEGFEVKELVLNVGADWKPVEKFQEYDEINAINTMKDVNRK